MEVCGDGDVGPNEACDDSNTADGDGCDASCEVEAGYTCDGNPSVCTTTCGDGVAAGTEECDDTNVANLDGCNAMCAVESGWDCTGTMPSVCTTTCGDGLIGADAEECDDSNATALDGCADDCTIEDGWSCMGEPSVCMTSCGDGIIAGTEVCDDANMIDGDGCTSCAVDLGYGCTGSPSVCDLIGDCASPIIVTDGTVFQWVDMNDFGDDLQNSDASCIQPSTAMGAHPDLVFQIDLAVGELLHVAESGGADVLFHVLNGACASASTCLESFDGIGNSEINPGLTYTATTAGPHTIVIDSWISDPDPVAGEADLDLLFEIVACGDGVVSVLEPCDDGGTAPGDGCSATCTVEQGFTCTGQPSVCTPVPGQDCTDAIVASDGFTFTGSNIANWGDDLDFPTAPCTDVGGAGFDSPEIVFSVDLLAGQLLQVREFGTLDVVMHILGGTCADGALCAASTDFNETTTGVQFTAPADGTYFVVVESFSATPSSASTFDIRFSVSLCGDGVVGGNETCDDGGTAPGDGCSATCAVEAGFACNGSSPSTCFNVTMCTTATCYLGPCSGTVVTASPVGLPAAIPDNPATDLPIIVAATGTIQRLVVGFSATHTFDGDLDISLAAPGGTLPGADLCSDNGGAGDNFTSTFLRDGVATAVTAGTAPFTGVFRPETALATFAGQSVNGTWTLRFDDDAAGDIGEVTAAEIAFCVTP